MPVVKSARVTSRNVSKHLSEYLNMKALADQAAERLAKQKALLMEYVEANGVEDEKGHRWVEVDGVGSIKRERRVSSSMDTDYAEEWLKENGLYEECTTTIVVLDEDEILAKIFDETIPPKVAKRMFAERESFAFKATPAT